MFLRGCLNHVLGTLAARSSSRPTLAILADPRVFGLLLPMELARPSDKTPSVFQCFFRQFREPVPNRQATEMGHDGRDFR